MSNKPSDQPKVKRIDLAELVQRVKANAAARVARVKTPDSRGLEGDSYLAGLGETYLRQQITHTSQLHYVRLAMLGFLLLLVILWLASIPTLLFLGGTKWKDFELSDTVMVTYIGSTTISVLGLMRIATRWLFTGGLPDITESVKEILHRK
jgi:hypothetical protein